jgi:hypothetical protein
MPSDLKTVLLGFIPQDPKAGPPLPKNIGLGWPSIIANYFIGGIDRASKEGILAPWKTTAKEGLFSELKQEIGWITGSNNGNSSRRK